MVEIVETCTILHSMLVRLSLLGELYDEEDENGNPIQPNEVVTEFVHASGQSEDGNDDSGVVITVQMNHGLKLL